MMFGKRIRKATKTSIHFQAKVNPAENAAVHAWLEEKLELARRNNYTSPMRGILCELVEFAMEHEQAPRVSVNADMLANDLAAIKALLERGVTVSHGEPSEPKSPRKFLNRYRDLSEESDDQ